MPKDFDKWNIKKKSLDQKTNLAQFNHGEVRWCGIGENIGDEENGKGNEFTRPVLVIRKFNNNLFYGVPLSKQLKNNKYYYEIEFQGEQVSVLISQMRILDAKRFGNRLGKISGAKLNEVINAIKGTF